MSVPGHGHAKLNSAYPAAYTAAKNANRSETAAQSAGILATIRTIHALTGLHIDHYMQVNLLGFYRISEAIGGVTVCLNAAQNKTTETGDGAHGNSGIDLPKGVSVIKGRRRSRSCGSATACRTATSTASSASSTSSSPRSRRSRRAARCSTRSRCATCSTRSAGRCSSTRRSTCSRSPGSSSR